MKILVVDDEVVIRELLQEIILIHGLCRKEEIWTAKDGEEGLALFQEHQPQIVLTDMMMPKMNGAKLIENLRHMTTETEIVIMTGFADLEMAIAVMKLGVFEFLKKPFQPEEISLVIRKIEEKIRLKTENEEFRKKLLDAEKFSSLGLLAAGIAHEINNPNTFVKGNLELLMRYFSYLKPCVEKLAQDENEEQHLKYKMIHDHFEHTVESALLGSERIRKIVAGLLSFSRSSEAEKTLTTIKPMIEAALIMAAYRTKDHTVILEIADPLPLIEVNEQEIVQVFLNLIINAMDALDDHFGLESVVGKLVVRVFEEKSRVVIQFEDNGVGMNAETLKRCFDPFFTTKPVGKGTGLGMSISKGNVEKNGGAIDCQSIVNQHTIFTLRFPFIRGVSTS